MAEPMTTHKLMILAMLDQVEMPLPYTVLADFFLLSEYSHYFAMQEALAELLEQNELGTYMMRLGAEIQEYKEKKRRITGTAVAASTNVDLFSEDGYDFARLQSNYSIIEGGEKSNTVIVYLLRKDAQKRWKIYGWTSAENVTVGKETE